MREFKVIRDFKEIREIKDHRDFKKFRDSKLIKDIRYFKDIRDFKISGISRKRCYPERTNALFNPEIITELYLPLKKAQTNYTKPYQSP